VQLGHLRSITAAVHGMLQHVVQQQQDMQQAAAEARGEQHVEVDPAQLLLQAMLHQQHLLLGHDEQQQQQEQEQQDDVQQQQIHEEQQQTVVTGVAGASPRHDSSSSSSEGCALWGKLLEVDDCPADPLVLAVLLAVAPEIQTLRFRSQQCRYYEVTAEQPAGGWWWGGVAGT
jgi:hypothetical protein